MWTLLQLFRFFPSVMASPVLHTYSPVIQWTGNGPARGPRSNTECHSTIKEEWGKPFVAVTCRATARQITVIIKTNTNTNTIWNLFFHQMLFPVFFVQRKAFSYITVSYFREATLFAFPVLNDKGVASSVHTGCPENPNQVGRKLHWTHSDSLLTSAPNPRKWSSYRNKPYNP